MTQKQFMFGERKKKKIELYNSKIFKCKLNLMRKQLKQQHAITGVATGFTALDELTSGFQPSDMIILAARPSVGKTAFALNVARFAAVEEVAAATAYLLSDAAAGVTGTTLTVDAGSTA